MTADEENPPPAGGAQVAPGAGTSAFGQPAAMLSAEGMLRVVVALLGVWALYSGLTLTIWQGIDVATVAGDLESGPAARLVGVHLLVLWPVFWLIAWDIDRFRWLLWLPYAHQAGVFVVTTLDVVRGRRDFTDAALPLVVTAFFLVLLGYIALMRRQAAPVAPAPATEAEGRASESEPRPVSGPPQGPASPHRGGPLH
jgi:hypothetical protein